MPRKRSVRRRQPVLRRRRARPLRWRRRHPLPTRPPLPLPHSSPAPGLRAAEAPAPAGPCADFEIRRYVFVVVDRATPWPSTDGCTKIAPSQELLLSNGSSETVNVVLGARRFEVPTTDREYLNAGRAEDLLAPGLHTLGGRQYWLVAEPPRRLPTAQIEMGRYRPAHLGHDRPRGAGSPRWRVAHRSSIQLAGRSPSRDHARAHGTIRPRVLLNV
jgi:hypothetical protein